MRLGISAKVSRPTVEAVLMRSLRHGVSASSSFFLCWPANMPEHIELALLDRIKPSMSGASRWRRFPERST